MKTINQKRIASMVLFAALSTVIFNAHADNDRHERGGSSERPVPLNTTFKQECSTCHIAYSPSLLTAESWRQVMGGLSKHFGSDASLTEVENKEITAFLIKNASTRSTPSSPLRITETAWFKRKHDAREISPSVWKSSAVKSASNCAACHPRADQGNFNEHEIRMPN